MRADITNLGLANQGRLRIEWAAASMPVLRRIAQRFKKERPLRGVRVSACLHVTTETAVLVEALVAGGANVCLCASNPLSTQDDTAASLVKHLGVAVFARKGEDKATYYRHIQAAVQHRPQVVMDDGADLISTIHAKHPALARAIIGGTEETTTGVIRLRSLAHHGRLLFPVIAVNDADTKHLFDNRYGTGQSTIDGILRATNRLLAGSVVVVCGYGWCGRGVALRAKGMGSDVVIVEVDPLRALEAVMDGYRVLPMREAARCGEVFITVTGNAHIMRREHFAAMKDGAIVCNAGHFNVEIDIPALAQMSRRRRRIRESVEEFTLKNGRRVNLLADGRLINLAAAEGHPSTVMDMSFANQALSAEHLITHGKKLARQVHPVPPTIDRGIARLKLDALGIKIDRLTPEQTRYLASWELGT